MKNKILFLLLCPFAAMAQTSNFSIVGKIAQPDSKKLAYLNYFANNQTHTDSSKIVDGAFTFKGAVKDPVLGYLSIHPPLHHGEHFSGMIQIYVEPGEITVSSPDSLAHARVTGTPMNKDYQELRAELQAIDDRASVIQKQYALLTDEEKKSRQKDYYIKFGSFAAERSKAMKAFMKSHPASLTSLDVMNTLVGPVPEVRKTDSLFRDLSPSVKSSPKGRQIAEMIEKLKSVDIGSIAPEFTQADTTGKPISLSSFRGKYVLIDFWASWCVPCRAENPAVVKAYNHYKDKNFTILSVSLDRENAKKAWIDAINKDGLTWTNVADFKFFNNVAAQLYSVRAIPQNFLLDPQGRIVAKNLRGEELEKKLGEIIR